MKDINWIIKLKEEGVLIEGTKNNKVYLHLQTPCKIHLTDTAIKQLRDNYQTDQEKGGVLVAIPKRINNVTHLTINRIILLTNVSDTPQNSYLPNMKELKQAYKDTYSGQMENSLPIHFQTHPTHSDNPINELFNYIFQCNTSKQDQLVSDIPFSIGGLNVLMPRSLVLCNGKNSEKLFIGFYNGLIAPIEFETHRNKQTQNAIESISKSISEWAKEENNKWWLVGGGIALALIIVHNNKFAIPLIFMLFLMLRMFIDDTYTQPKYFAQIKKETITIDLPGLEDKTS